MNILTGPFLTKHASPVSFLGPKRFVGGAIALNELPTIDVVVVSHNHYDHLDDKTVRNLPSKDNIHVVPLGLKIFLLNEAIAR